jgi:arabinan endo-1,5-alpha-L-arabinosidase
MSAGNIKAVLPLRSRSQLVASNRRRNGRMRNLLLALSWLTAAAVLHFWARDSSAQPTRLTPPPPLAPAEAERQADLGSRGVRVHDPSTIVKCKEHYWVFYTGRGIPSYRSIDMVEWEAGPPVFEAAPAWVPEAVPENRNMYFWAPDIICVNGQYLIYYSVSSFGKNTSAIALATNSTLNPQDPKFRWTDGGIVIQSRLTNEFNAIDPALFRDQNGTLWMSFGSFWSGIKMIELDPATGKRITPDSPIYALAHHDTIEAPFLYHQGGRYYLFVNWGICCRGTNSTYEIRVGRADTVTGPYRDREGRDLLFGGGTRLLGTEDVFIGPGHAGIWHENGKHWLSFHFYNGAQRGLSTYAIRPLSWDNQGWPEVQHATQPAK